jgi:hypothetical protein
MQAFQNPIDEILGLQEIEWVDLRGHSAGSMHDIGLLRLGAFPETRYDEAGRNLASDSIVCRTGIRSQASARKRHRTGLQEIQLFISHHNA